MNIEKLRSFFYKVLRISEKYEEIAKITGENFNIFKILKLESDEVRTHSGFIAELLNPEGSHGLKDTFLRLFIKQLNIEKFSSSDAVVEIEKNIGNINEEKTEGGRLDIVIRDRKNKAGIIIENKIYAADQEKQLVRYNNYGKKTFKRYNIFYLTLDGHRPSKGSITHKNKKVKHITTISYKYDIIKWLKKCREESVNYPLLRETITQYINLIKMLTGGAMNDKMKEEIEELILNDPNLIDAVKISEEVRYSILECAQEKLKKEMDNQYPEKVIFKKDGYKVVTKWDEGENKDGRVYIVYILMQDDKNVSEREEAKEYRKILEEIINKKELTNDNESYNIIWFNPREFENKRKIEDLSNEYIVKICNDEDFLKLFVNKIVKEAEEINEEFLAFLSEKNN